MIGKGYLDQVLIADEMRRLVSESLGSLALDGQRVLIVIPDATRSMPMPQMAALFQEFLGPRAAAFDYLIALGTHQPLNDAQKSRLIGQPVMDGITPTRNRIDNHEWSDPENFRLLGVIPANEVDRLTHGLMSQEVPVSLNKLIFEYDQLILCGPVFPHEVVGFSGGNKYFFPGIAGAEIIHFTHWLGALLTQVIGSGYTPVRAIIDRAAAFIDRPVACFCLVVTHEGTSGFFFGSAPEAWRAAAALSAQKHIIYVEQPFRRVLSVMPNMYDDLWTAAKGMYKLEPAVADGGEVVIYAPHITEVSYTHGKLLDEIGYHCRDYFLAHWDQFKDYSGGVLAHSTHLRGLGSYHAATGVESTRIQVTLATGIPPQRCQRLGLGYLDPAEVKLEAWQGREGEGIVVIPRAGEILYRLR